ncbi:MAG TPA: cadherin repeat domain-containing protein, partial [Gammaproteobacteria bacterium]|nr:cadherin repeat domain-containing protein [Gammaproteobacteria bacterium]
LGFIEAEDADTNTALQQWRITSGNDDGFFVLDSNSGELKLSATASLDYETQPAFTLYVSVSDGVHTSTSTAVRIIVANADEKPAAADDLLTTDEDQRVTTDNVFTNDTPGDNPIALFAFAGSSTQGGDVSYLGDGAFSYTPKPDFNGMDSFTYTIRDASGDLSTANVWIMVNAVNDPVIGEEDHYSTEEDQTLNVTADNGVLGNDFDIDQDKLSVTLIDNTTHGQLQLNADGSFRYTPNRNFNGSDGFIYQVADPAGTTSKVHVALDISATNDAPNALDSRVTLDEDSRYVFTLQDFGFSDVDGDQLAAIEIPRLPEAGSILLNDQPISSGEVVSANDIAAGHLVFIPDQNTFGEIYATAGFRVFDGSTGSQETASLAISVRGVDDPPVIVTPQTLVTLMNNDVSFDTGLARQLSLQDIDEKTQLQSVTLRVSSGTLTFSSTPDLNSISGTDSAEIKLTGTAEAIDDALSQLLFIPETGFAGEVKLTMVAGDHGEVNAELTLFIGSPAGINVETSEHVSPAAAPDIERETVHPVIRKLHGLLAAVSPSRAYHAEAMEIEQLQIPEFQSTGEEPSEGLIRQQLKENREIWSVDMASMTSVTLNPAGNPQAYFDALKDTVESQNLNQTNNAATSELDYWKLLGIAGVASLTLGLLAWSYRHQKNNP